MRVTTKGQVTIPRAVREVLGIKAETEIGFIEENRRFYISKSEPPKQSVQFNKLRGVATVNIPTNVIMALTREVESAR